MNNGTTTTPTSGGAPEIDSRILDGALNLAMFITVALAGVSFWASYGALSDLALMAGNGPSRAWVFPVALDGTILATTAGRLALSKHHDLVTVRGRRYIMAVLVVAAAGTIVGNGYHAYLNHGVLPSFVAAGVAIIAPVCLLAMTEVLAVLFRAPQSRAAQQHQPTKAVELDVDDLENTHLLDERNQEEGGDLRVVDQFGKPLDPGVLEVARLKLRGWQNNRIAAALGVADSTVSRRWHAYLAQHPTAVGDSTRDPQRELLTQ